MTSWKLFNTEGKYYRLGLHLMVWLVLFGFPYLLSHDTFADTDKLFEHFWLPLFYSAIIFYLNLYVFIDRLLFGGRIMLFVLFNVLLILFFFGLHFELRQLFFAPEHVRIILRDPNGDVQRIPPFRLFLYKDVISLVIPVIFSIAVRAMERWLKTEGERKEAEREKLVAELRDLKYRLQPHFFFNSLNNIYSLVDVAPDKAKETLHSLGKLMRYLLYETETDRVELAHEIEFLNKYIGLMRLRLSDHITVEVDFPEKIPGSVTVAPLLFITLIENAFKHGVSAAQASEIAFQLRVEGHRIYFVSHNTDFPKTDADTSGSGIGLENLRKRLALVYPNKHAYTAVIRNGVYYSELWIDVT